MQPLKGHADAIAVIQEVAGDLLDIDCADSSGSTALLLAVEGDHEAAVEQLLLSHPVVDEDCVSNTHRRSSSGEPQVSMSPLQCATVGGKFRIVRLLLDWLRQKEKASLIALEPKYETDEAMFSDLGRLCRHQ